MLGSQEMTFLGLKFNLNPEPRPLTHVSSYGL